jgi:general secretion pathway protein K
MNRAGQQFVHLPRQQRGLALVMVLWLVVLLGIIASGHAYNAHTETRLAAMHVQSAKARAAVETGLSYAILQLLAEDLAKPWPIDGTVKQILFDDTQIRIAVRDATGLIDLNAAGPDLLQTLTAALHVDQDRQRRIVAAILDWRDGDDIKHPGGAEESDYLSGDYPWTPRDGVFSSVEELRYVMGMTQQLFNEMTPFVTVYSEQAGINPEFTAPFLINAMQGQFVMPAANHRLRNNAQTAAATGSGTYHIYVSSTNNEGIGASAEAVIRISDNRERPYQTLYWRDSMRTRFPDTVLAEL